jgi:hypothetical protein
MSAGPDEKCGQCKYPVPERARVCGACRATRVDLFGELSYNWALVCFNGILAAPVFITMGYFAEKYLHSPMWLVSIITIIGTLSAMFTEKNLKTTDRVTGTEWHR